MCHETHRGGLRVGLAAPGPGSEYATIPHTRSKQGLGRLTEFDEGALRLSGDWGGEGFTGGALEMGVSRLSRHYGNFRSFCCQSATPFAWEGP